MKYFSVVYSAIFAPYAAFRADFGVVYLGLTAPLASGFARLPPVDSLFPLSRDAVCAKPDVATAAMTRNVETDLKIDSLRDMVFSWVKDYQLVIKD
jgi:hypothetical protein